MNGREAKQINTGFWKLVMDPNVSNEHFLKIHREFMARREALERAQGRSISRREFVALSAGISTAFGLASLVGSATLSRPAQAQPTAKGVKKGLMRIGYINTLDCCLLDYVLEKKGILQSMGWDVKFIGQPSGPQVMEAFIANEVDFAYVGSNTPGMAAQRGIFAKHLAGGMMGMGGWNAGMALHKAWGWRRAPACRSRCCRRAWRPTSAPASGWPTTSRSRSRSPPTSPVPRAPSSTWRCSTARAGTMASTGIRSTACGTTPCARSGSPRRT